MAISHCQYQLLKLMRSRGLLHVGPVLEIGQANYYMDANPHDWHADIDHFTTGKRREELHRKLDALLENVTIESSFPLARFLYDFLFGLAEPPDAIDAGGIDEHARHLDLNHPIAGLKKYTTVINHGTAEHVFNLAQVFKTIHDATQAGGTMIHESPFTGWIDHGFYCLQPTLFYDLAAANEYEIELVAIEHLPSRSYTEVTSREQIHELAHRDQLPYNAMLFVALRKWSNHEFRLPIQGVYAGSVSEAVENSWQKLR